MMELEIHRTNGYSNNYSLLLKQCNEYNRTVENVELQTEEIHLRPLPNRSNESSPLKIRILLTPYSSY